MMTGFDSAAAAVPELVNENKENNSVKMQLIRLNLEIMHLPLFVIIIVIRTTLRNSLIFWLSIRISTNFKSSFEKSEPSTESIALKFIVVVVKSTLTSADRRNRQDVD